MPDNNARVEHTGRVMDITPQMPNSPVVDVVKDFIESLYNTYSQEFTDNAVALEQYRRIQTFLKARHPRLLRAMREILADDAAILYMNKLPDDRTRMIGTKRRLVP